MTIHLNPGGCQKGEEAKCFSHLQKLSGWLLKRFATIHGRDYSKYQAAESPLSEDNTGRNPSICGVPWWLAGAGELDWIRQVLGDGSIKGKRLFATELCPYHSQKWGLGLNRRIVQHLLNRVFFPATVAAVGARHQMIVCRGAQIANVLERYCGLTPVWPPEGCTPALPHSKAQYRLYTVNGANGVFERLNSWLPSGWQVYFLVYSISRSYRHPSRAYQAIENSIRQSINYRFALPPPTHPTTNGKMAKGKHGLSDGAI